jgi:pimeloyl-ACP methyl ester carboxylesterase
VLLLRNRLTYKNPSSVPKRGWARNIAPGFVSLLLLVTSGGVVYQWVTSLRDRHTVHAPGEMVDMGGYRLHLYCTGKGDPTVLLETGLGDSYLHWRKVQPGVAEFTRVCSYDRAGLGWSDPSPRVRTGSVIAQELHELLQREGVHQPFVLVGHSIGGFYVRTFQSLYPSATVGVVLVDSSHPDQERRLPANIKHLLDDYLGRLRRNELLMPLGIPRLAGWCGVGPAELETELRVTECNTVTLRETLAESANFERSANEIRSARKLGNLPVTVISEDPEKNVAEFRAAFEEMQADLATLSSRSTRRIAIGSGHQIPLEKPDVVVDAIRTMVEDARQSPDHKASIH